MPSMIVSFSTLEAGQHEIETYFRFQDEPLCGSYKIIGQLFHAYLKSWGLR